jgi:CBS domain-containing protein
MIEEQIHRVLVGSIGHVVGIISSHDLLELIR